MDENLKDMQIDDIPLEQKIDDFILDASLGICTRDQILDNIEIANNKVNEINEAISNLDSKDKSDCTKIDEFKNELLTWEGYLTQLQDILSEYKNFNKKLVFSNIRTLLAKNPDVKIGQIEKEAGIRLGYMSRLEKEGNTSEPSVEFVVTAAKLLKVSLDTLVNVDVSALTPTEEYLIKFFDKLKKDTIADKLCWDKETADKLNRLSPDINGDIDHPLFSYEEIYENNGLDYPEAVNRVVFVSDSFKTNTYINDDCFRLRLKNATYIYMMDITKASCYTNDPNRYAKEIWTWSPRTKPKLLISNKGNTPLALVVDVLFNIIKERDSHPKIESSFKYSFDAFMNDDLSDDEDNDLPF